MSRKKRRKTIRSKEKGRKTPSSLKQEILKILDSNPNKALSVSQISHKLHIHSKKKDKTVRDILFRLEDELRVERRGNHFASRRSTEKQKGKFCYINPRISYISSEAFEEDAMVYSQDFHNAIDGDTVEFVILQQANHGEKALVKITKVLERAKDIFPGKVQIDKRSDFAFVLPTSRKMKDDIFIYPEYINGAVDGDLVTVQITKWATPKNNPEGKIVRVLGKKGEHNAEIHAIMAEYDLPFEFPTEVEAAAASLTDEITPADLEVRRDMRKTTTFTIDPLDAKDFDDAISVRKMKNGHWEIGVHIADVSHYVKPGSILDQEAIDRATSVYLVDRTIPMLPEKLSNGLCSLRPNEDKFTFSAVFEITTEAEIKKSWFGRTLTHSDRRFTYEEAQEGIETGAGDFHEELVILNELARKMKAQRFKNGAINFETSEVKFLLDEKGKPIGMRIKERKDAHKLVEEFMLLANRRVAEFVHFKNKKEPLTFVFRAHDDPDPEKLSDFSTFASKFGHQIKFKGDKISNALNNLLTKIQGKPEQSVLEQLAIRSMAKAVYTTDPIGHFGLAFAYYTHFTSPIRRYPDVMVHRLLQRYLEGGKSADKKQYEALCKHSSAREKRAAEAERASIKFKQVEYMASVKEKEFEGVITGITDFGIFVEIEATKCEGLCRLAELEGDFFEFREKRMEVVGRRTGRKFILGERVNVEVIKTDIDKRTIDLVILDDFFY